MNTRDAGRWLDESFRTFPDFAFGYKNVTVALAQQDVGLASHVEGLRYATRGRQT